MIRLTYAYIGRCPACKVTVASVYDMVDDRKFTSDTVASMIRRGLEVERVPLQTVNPSPDGCICTREQKETKGLPLFAEGLVAS